MEVSPWQSADGSCRLRVTGNLAFCTILIEITENPAGVPTRARGGAVSSGSAAGFPPVDLRALLSQSCQRLRCVSQSAGREPQNFLSSRAPAVAVDQFVQLEYVDRAGVQLREPFPYALEQVLQVVRAIDAGRVDRRTAAGCKRADHSHVKPEGDGSAGLPGDPCLGVLGQLADRARQLAAGNIGDCH